MPYPGFYFDGECDLECTIKRMGSQNSRIIMNGVEQLVPSERVRRAGDADRNLAELILPLTPLDRLYRSLRRLTGSKEAKFEAIRDLLSERHGAIGSTFLCELFRRSVSHAHFYNNVDEAFCPERAATKTNTKYARTLVNILGNSPSVTVGGSSISLIDFEIFPFRTTYSCTERGKPASATAGGGMDMLLATNSGQVRPAIGEIKADTEVVGPTFALIQSLMYASQMATPNQFRRLAKHYPQPFGQLLTSEPSIEIVIILESFDGCVTDDLNYAQELSSSLCEELSDIVPAITLVECAIRNDNLSFRL